MGSQKPRFTIRETPFGAELVITGRWTTDIRDYIVQHRIRSLHFNFVKGWEVEPLDFLAQVPTIEGLTVIADCSVSASFVGLLRGLQRLSLTGLKPKSLANVELPALKECFLSWDLNPTKLLDLESLIDLGIVGYARPDISEMKRLRRLRRLRLWTSRLHSLNGIRDLADLEYLGLYQLVKLESLDQIEEAAKLRFLEVDTCRKITNIRPLAGLTHLEHLDFSNCNAIESLAPIAKLKSLKALLFAESTNIVDGDLSLIDSLPKLRNLAFMNRKHYNRICESYRAYHEVSEYTNTTYNPLIE